MTKEKSQEELLVKFVSHWLGYNSESTTKLRHFGFCTIPVHIFYNWKFTKEGFHQLKTSLQECQNLGFFPENSFTDFPHLDSPEINLTDRIFIIYDQAHSLGMMLEALKSPTGADGLTEMLEGFASSAHVVVLLNGLLKAIQGNK